MSTILEAAKAAHAAGLSVIRVKADGSKEPLGTWKEYQKTRAPIRIVEQWFSGTSSGLGAVAGAVSNNLEVFDFDAREILTTYLEAAEATGLGELVARIRRGYEETTPNGVHWLYRCTTIGGNTKLARRPKRPDEMLHPKDSFQVLIETRGEGGYCILAPSNGKVHPDGGRYELVSGGFDTITTITPEERQQLFDLARAFDQVPVTDTGKGARTGVTDPTGGRPGDDFIARADWHAILEPHGWKAVHKAGDLTFWRRPGKNKAHSATTNYAGSDLLYVFSSSTVFEQERGYNKFSAYAILNHDGDWKAAAKELASRGYGSPRPSANGSVPEDPDAPAGEADDNRPWIHAGIDDLPVITAMSWGALRQANVNPRLFRHGGILVRLERDDHHAPVLSEMTPDRMRNELARDARFFVDLKAEGDDGKPERKIVKPPTAVVRDVLATADPPLPVITRIVETPVFAPDGTLQTTPGYHPASRTYHAPRPGWVLPALSANPSTAEVEKAKKLILDDLLGDFPFVEAADEAHAVAALLLPFVRDMIDEPTPGHMIEASTPGSGKGLLADVLLRPGCGRSIGVVPEAKDDDEWRKRITAQLREGQGAILIDNIVRPMDSGTLSSALTAITWTDRVLGRNEMIRLPVRCVWLATANNPVMTTELARRFIRIRLDPMVDRPWQREGFRKPKLRLWTDEHRADLVWAALTLVKAWIAAGQPDYSGKPLGSYERWSTIIGGMLQSAGIDGFLSNLDQFYEAADAEGAVWRQFVAAWWDKFGKNEVGAADLFQVALTVDGFEVGGKTERAQQITFGKKLAAKRDRVIGDYRITYAGIEHKAKRWKLLPTRDLFGKGECGEYRGMSPNPSARESAGSGDDIKNSGWGNIPKHPPHSPPSGDLRGPCGHCGESKPLTDWGVCNDCVVPEAEA